ncbi:MAG: cobyrinic acid a,c-diamide synthase [Alteromonadaceae bacterium]|nr:MAG: cobyrinic acid a,c-diamide synthase [Alteromonadaceae bacterium]
MKVIACYSMKGGVGKTATAVNIAYWAAKSGIKTLLIDLDAQGASSFYFRVKAKNKSWDKRFFDAYKHLLDQVRASDYENLDVIPAHLSFRNFDTLLSTLSKRKTRLKKILRGLSNEYKLIILDCPPTISALSESVFTASNTIFVPVIPTTLSERTYDQLNNFFDQHDYSKKKLVPFFSMVQGQKNLHHRTMDTMRSRYKSFMKAFIPFSIDVENMGEYRAPVDVYARSRPANRAYVDLWKEMVPLIRKR